jgi:hypothetical protein
MRILVISAALAFATSMNADPCAPPATFAALAPSPGKSDRGAPIARIREALANSPDDLFLNRWLIELQPNPHTGSLAAEFHAKLDKRPGDPRYAFLYAYSLIGKDTPSATRSLGELAAATPNFPWTYSALADVFSSPAFHDEVKLAGAMRAYLKVCPANLDAFAHLDVIQDDRTSREFSMQLRSLLQTASAAPDLVYWRTLWSAEFRLAPPSELERRVATAANDLKKIERLAKDGNLAVLDVLREGYRLSGQKDAEGRISRQIAAAGERDPALDAYHAWEKEHPRGSTPVESAAYADALYQASATWVQQWPASALAWRERRSALLATRSHSPEDWKQVADGLARADTSRDPHYLKYHRARLGRRRYASGSHRFLAGNAGVGRDERIASKRPDSGHHRGGPGGARPSIFSLRNSSHAGGRGYRGWRC